MAVRRFRSWRTTRRSDLQPDRHRQIKRYRSAGLAGRCPGPHRRASGPQDRRVAAVELEKIKAASCCCLMDLTSADRRTRVIRAKEAAMHRNPKQWAYIRRLILEEGHSRKGVSRMTG